RTGGRNRHGKILEASANWSWFESIGSESAPLDPEFLVLARTAPASKVRGGHALLALRLNFEHLERSILPATNEELRTSQKECAFFPSSLWAALVNRPGSGQAQHFAAKLGARARPRLESAEAVVDFLCGAMEVDAAVFSGKDRCERGLVTILGPGGRGSRLQVPQSLDH